MLTISKKDVTGNLGPDNRPAAFCKSGDTVLFETRDCYDDRLMANGTLLDPENTLSNPATGPLYIEEACPGDVLKVEILKISLNPTGIMQALPGAGTFGDLLTEECVRQFSIEDGMVPFNETLQLPLQPMIGVIGTSPESSSISTHIPGDHGGNMDCTKISEDTTLYLPVFVPGALLSMGDLHAVMGMARFSSAEWRLQVQSQSKSLCCRIPSFQRPACFPVTCSARSKAQLIWTKPVAMPAMRCSVFYSRKQRWIPLHAACF